MHNLRKLLQLSPGELWFLAQAAVLLPTVRMALNFTSVARLQEVGARRVRPSLTRRLSPEATARVVRIAALHGVYRARCLEQSLVLRWLLLKQGTDARILFGTRKECDQMQAHAWVEVGGVALNEDDGAHRDFLRFDEMASSNVS